MSDTGGFEGERQLWLPWVDARARAPLQGWPLPPQSAPLVGSQPERIELIELVYPCEGWLWAGWPTLVEGAARAYQPVEVVGETSAGLRVVVRERIRLPDGRWLEEGEAALVPRGAVAFERPES